MQSGLVSACVEFELKNAYFRVGARNMHQRVGVAMGAMPSAEMAMLDSRRREGNVAQAGGSTVLGLTYGSWFEVAPRELEHRCADTDCNLVGIQRS